MNLSDLLGGSSVELGAIATMPSTTATTITMPNGDVLVSNPTGGTTLVSTSLCAAALPVIVNSVNDTVLGGTISKLTGFSYIAQILANQEISAGGLTQYKPKMFYVGGVYYIFNSYANGVGYTSSTDNVNWTPVQAISMISASNVSIVDITNVAGVWYFLDSGGLIYSTTDVSVSANPTVAALPVASYRKFAYINSNWYIVGASRTGSGYIIVKSATLSSFTITENTSSVGTAISICQGSGSAGTTEILVTLAADNIVKSVDNGTTFVLVSAITAIAGAIIRNCLYSTTTNKYHLAVVGTSNVVTMVVSSGSTLTGATWTLYTCATGSASSINANITIADTGTNVGLAFLSNTGTYNFYYGASYNTVGTAIITTTDKNIVDNASIDHGVSYWLNNKLFVFYGAGTTFGWASLFGASGVTISSGITRLLSFHAITDTWSGLTYLSGSYYSFNTIIGLTTAVGDRLAAFLYKFASNLTTISCPVSPITVGVSSITSAGTKSHGVYDSTGTKINWMACDLLVSTGNYCFTYDGSVFISTAVNANNGQPVSALNTYNTDTSLTYTNLSAQKWSSLYSKYIFAMPCSAAHATVAGTSVRITSTATIGGAQTDIFSLVQQAVGTTNPTSIVACDILNDGQIVYGYTYVILSGPTYFASYVIANPTTKTTIYTYNTSVSGGGAGMWNFSYGGSNYLVVISIENSTGTIALRIWKLSTTDQSTLIYSDIRTGSYSNISMTTITNGRPNNGNGMLKRTMLYNGEIYLLDSSTINITNKSSLKLTPVGSTFAVTPVNLYTTGDGGATGNANVYMNNNSVTTANTTLTPTVVLAAAPTANAYLRIK